MSATLGIDLASRPATTALCQIAWTAGRAEVVALWRGAAPDGAQLDDALLVAAIGGERDGLARPAKVALDAPLGWPVDFAAALANPAVSAWPVALGGARTRLERRATDLWVHERFGKLPLSVSTDRIAYPAMRAAGLLAHCDRLAAAAGDRAAAIDRSGVRGPVCETYPDPAIRQLGLWPAEAGRRESYKGAPGRALRERIVDRLASAAPWLALSAEQRRDCAAFDDCLDALVCALAARAAARSLTIPPPPALRAEAAREGWIHLPVSDALDALP